MIKQDIIEAINRSNFSVLEIFNPFCKNETTMWFIPTTFTIPQGHITEYIVTGYDATNIINQDSLHVQNMDKRNIELTLLTKVQSLSVIEKKISKDFSYIWHTKTTDIL